MISNEIIGSTGGRKSYNRFTFLQFRINLLERKQKIIR